MLCFEYWHRRGDIVNAFTSVKFSDSRFMSFGVLTALIYYYPFGWFVAFKTVHRATTLWLRQSSVVYTQAACRLQLMFFDHRPRS